jgi:putative hemolysin
MLQNVSNPSDHQLLIDLSRASNPFVRALLPVLGPALNRLLAIDETNQVHLEVAQTATPETFFSRTLEVLGCRYEVSESDLDRIPESGPVVVVSNHPHGGLDGIILGDMLRKRRKDVRLLANFLLRKVEHAEQHMIFVDPFANGRPLSHNIGPLRECIKHLRAGGLLGVFPVDKVSHFQWRRREIADAEWVPHIAGLIRRTGASAVPVFIEGGNSTLFNFAGMIHPRVRTLLLMREFIRQGRSGKPCRVHVGAMIPPSRLKRFATDAETIRFLRVNTYFLGNRPKANAVMSSTPFAERQKHAEPIARPLPPEKLAADIAALPPDACLVRHGDSEVYLADFQQLPHVMHEIGRGRETSFRAAGGGALTALDLAPQDQYYKHLFLWNKRDRAIAGGYRLGLADKIIPVHGHQGLICSKLFHFKPEFVKKLNPGIELGRSYILPEYQRNYNSLMLLWAGVLAFVARHPKYNIMFGSVALTHGSSFAPASRTLIVNFLRQQHSDDSLAVHIEPQVPFRGVRLHGITPDEVSDLVHDVEDVSTLVSGLENDGRGVPVLFKQYTRMNAKLLKFGMWTEHGNSVVGFMIGDLTTADPKLLRRYMGEDPYRRFIELHGI